MPLPEGNNSNEFFPVTCILTFFFLRKNSILLIFLSTRGEHVWLVREKVREPVAANNSVGLT